MAKLSVGVLEIISDSVSQGRRASFYESQVRKAYASIMPQAVAVWCRQLGHEVHYATYCGQADPDTLLPDELDVVFFATDTRSSAITYALAKLCRQRGCLTVVGGSHARSFPQDCLRFFDLVVLDCDKTLIDEILRQTYDRHSIITSGRVLQEIPSVEERMPDHISATFTERGKPGVLNVIGVLSSVGCPYKCNFCIDWDNPYVMLPRENLEADLRFVSNHWPGLVVAYHDPNFGVRFDEVMDVIETIPKGSRNRYVAESSLSILRGPRLERLRDTNCLLVAPGIESWSDYSNKAGVGKKVGQQKLEQLVDHFHELHRHISGFQANFIFGTDVDEGYEPVALTKEFIRRLPFVWPTINIPMPFGGTPLYETHLAEDRILRATPFSFYYLPFLVTKLKSYDPIEYYEKLIEMYVEATTTRMLLRRLATTSTGLLKAHHALRTVGMRNDLRQLRGILARLKADPGLLAYHEGRSDQLPDFYHRLYRQKLGRYSELISDEEMRPGLEPPPAATAARSTAPLVSLGGAGGDTAARVAAPAR